MIPTMLRCYPHYLHKCCTTSVAAVLIVSAGSLFSGVRAWDSAAKNPKHPTHSYFTEWAIDQLKDQVPEVQQFREALVEGANTELHELPIKFYEKRLGAKYGIDLEAKRKQHKGTNEGCDDIQGWWQDSLVAYRQGNKEQAYFLLGVILHMVQDMGVPAHANRVYHQGNLKELDNFEYLAFWNWKPNFDDINRQYPAFAEPWCYYTFSQEWTRADAPNYHDRDSFSKCWVMATMSERNLLRNRQGRTCHVTMWALNSAVKAFGRNYWLGAK